ncbi:MAG: outer membrane protein transport protein [Deltaproteobacteria bacterium]|jgi:long-chain fatty acid transport protein|nr:outer membrane protein transport protein [Deltaproteobacteria bacterium]
MKSVSANASFPPFFKLATVFFSILAFFAIANASPARAEGFAIYDYGARGSALGGAALARKPDVSTVAHNAAQLTRLQGIGVGAGLTFIATNMTVNHRDGAASGSTDAKRGAFFIPHAYLTGQITPRLFFGVGEFSRFGLGNEYPADWPGRFNVVSTSLATFSLNPAIAWKATDKLSLGGGLELLYASLDFSARTLFPVEGVEIGEVQANLEKIDDVGLGFNLALHYRHSDEWAFGIQYRAPVKIEGTGEAAFDYVGPANEVLEGAFATVFHDGEAGGTVTLPESVAAGVSYSPTEKMSFELGVVWTGWSRYDSLDITLPSPLPVMVSPKEWKDSWRITSGAEFALKENLDLRLGYNWTESPMTRTYQDYSVPTENRHTFTAGLGYRTDDLSLDFAYVCVYSNGRNYDDNPYAAGGTGTVDSESESSFAHELALTVAYRF